MQTVDIRSHNINFQYTSNTFRGYHFSQAHKTITRLQWNGLVQK